MNIIVVNENSDKGDIPHTLPLKPFTKTYERAKMMHVTRFSHFFNKACELCLCSFSI